MFRIFGPPGTGKTTTLLNMVDKAFDEGVRPQDIAFLAFTRKAANEAKERACARFNLNPKEDLIYFRTLHSLALHLTGIRTEQIMQKEHYKELSHAIGVTLMTNNIGGDDFLDLNKPSDPILNIIDLARLKKIPLREQYNQSEINEVWNTVHYVSESLTKYKKLYKLFDFTDMLELFSKKAQSFKYRCKLTFLDEAQDLSPLQWDIAHALEKKSRQMYCAGDDDQAIYKWSGADVDHFINLPGSSEVLEQSYRVPSKIHELANRVCGRIVRRFPKNYLPKKEEGSVKRITGFEELDLTEGTWLFLSQAKFHLQGAHNFLKSQGFFFERSGGLHSVRLKVRQALEAWKLLQQGKPVVFDLVKTLYSYMTGNGVRIARGHKKIVGDEEDTFTFEELRDHHGLLATPDMSWQEALDKIPSVDVAYINSLVRRGEDLTQPPRIKLSTIHGAKGGEADNVVLYTDLTVAAEESMERDADSIHRVFYVAVTRSKQNLFIMEPENYSRSYAI